MQTNNILTLAGDWVGYFDLNSHWRAACAVARESERSIYVPYSHRGFSLGQDPSGAFAAVVGRLWQEHLWRERLTDPGLLLERRREIESELRVILTEDVPFYLDRAQAAVGKQLDWTTMTSVAERTLWGACDWIVQGRLLRDLERRRLGSEAARVEWQRQESEILERDRRALQVEIRKALEPRASRHGGFIVYDPRGRRVVDLLTAPDPDGEGGMRSIFEHGSCEVRSGIEGQTGVVGRNVEEKLRFLWGLYVVVDGGLVPRRGASPFRGVLRGVERSVEAEGVVEFTAFGSESAARAGLARLVSSGEGAEALTVRRIDDELVADLGVADPSLGGLDVRDR